MRAFKTRSAAAEACRSGKVELGEARAKPSRPVRVGDEIELRKDLLKLRIRVLGLPARRVGAKLVPEFAEDLTPPEEYEKLNATLAQRILARDRGSGRPTKKERRDLERLFAD